MIDLFFFLSPILIFTVHGTSMLPKFRPGTKVVVIRWREIKKGDVVVLKDPRTGRMILKRVEQIRQGEYFVEGDNKSESTDSRQFGWIQKKDIIGRAFCRIKNNE